MSTHNKFLWRHHIQYFLVEKVPYLELWSLWVITPQVKVSDIENFLVSYKHIAILCILEPVFKVVHYFSFGYKRV